MSWDTTIGKVIEETGGILAAVAGAIALRWAARRWPDRDAERPRPRPGRRDRRRTDDIDLEEEE